MEINPYVHSAMIGYYRSGATLFEIALLCGVTTWQARKFINQYLKKNDSKKQ